MRGVRFRTVDGHLAAGLFLCPLLFLLASSHCFVVGFTCVIRTHGSILHQVDLPTRRASSVIYARRVDFRLSRTGNKRLFASKRPRPKACLIDKAKVPVIHKVIQ
jgi:hypothetical protein